MIENSGIWNSPWTLYLSGNTYERMHLGPELYWSTWAIVYINFFACISNSSFFVFFFILGISKLNFLHSVSGVRTRVTKYQWFCRPVMSVPLGHGGLLTAPRQGNSEKKIDCCAIWCICSWGRMFVVVGCKQWQNIIQILFSVENSQV